MTFKSIRCESPRISYSSTHRRDPVYFIRRVITLIVDR